MNALICYEDEQQRRRSIQLINLWQKTVMGWGPDVLLEAAIELERDINLRHNGWAAFTGPPLSAHWFAVHAYALNTLLPRPRHGTWGKRMDSLFVGVLSPAPAPAISRLQAALQPFLRIA